MVALDARRVTEGYWCSTSSATSSATYMLTESGSFCRALSAGCMPVPGGPVTIVHAHANAHAIGVVLVQIVRVAENVV